MATMMGDRHSFFLFFFLEEKGGLYRFLYFPDPARGRCYSISGFDINFETIFIKDYSLDFASQGTQSAACCL